MEEDILPTSLNVTGESSCKASNQHCLQSCPCNRCVTVSLGLAKDWFANNRLVLATLERYARRSVYVKDITRFIG